MFEVQPVAQICHLLGFTSGSSAQAVINRKNGQFLEFMRRRRKQMQERRAITPTRYGDGSARAGRQLGKMGIKLGLFDCVQSRRAILRTRSLFPFTLCRIENDTAGLRIFITDGR